MPLVRKVAPGLRVGLSTHDEAQLEAAIAAGPDYVAIGPVFPTASKDRPSPVVGLSRLASLAARVRAARPGCWWWPSAASASSRRRQPWASTPTRRR